MLEVKGQLNAKGIAQQMTNGGSGSSTASDVTYDNTDSGLTADNVQSAIDELASASGGGGNDYTGTETKIGTFLGADLYRCVYTLNSQMSLASNAYENMSFSITFSKLIRVTGIGNDGNVCPMVAYKDGTALAIRPALSSGSVYVRYVIVEYTKS